MAELDPSLLVVEVEITLRKGGKTRTYSGILCDHIEFETEMDDVWSINDTKVVYGGDKPVKFLLHMHKPHQNSNGVWYTVTDDPPQGKHGP